MADGRVPVVVSPVPFTREVHDLAVREGSTVRAMLLEAVNGGKLAPRDLQRTTIYVDGVRLDRETALDVRLSAGAIVNVVVEPLGGGGGGRKDIGQIVLSIAVIALSAWVGGPAGPLAAWGQLARTVASAAVMTLGQAAVGALFAPDRDGQARANDRYALQNASNQYRPWSPFPLALGEVVTAPDLAVKTFTRAQGDDVWIYGILGVHYGPCEVSEVKIGDTLASTMGAGDVQLVQHLTPGPRTFQLYPNDTDQLDLTEELEATTSSATPVIRAASSEGERFEFDFFLPSGLHFQKDDGRVIAASLTLTVRYREIDENGAPVGSGAWSNGLTIPLTSTTREPWRVTRGLSLPMGRYEFEVKRSVKPDGNEKRRDQVAWTAVRAIAFRKPVTDETLSVIEFAVRATALNQGTLAPITCRIKPLCETWDPAANSGEGGWTAPVATSNPAALTRWLLSGPAPVRPEPAERVDLGLRDWSVLCETYDWTAHIYLTEAKTQAEAMALLEQAGRASLFWDGTQIVAAPWVEKPSPVQLFAGDNLRDHRWTLAYPEPVHALRGEFQNLEQGGEPDELYVYADGYGETADPANGIVAASLVEAVRFDGQKTPERVYRDLRWELGRRLHQRRVDTWTCDVEQLVSRYGSRVRLAWQRVDGGVSARVRVRRWSGGLVSGLRLSQPVTMLPGESYAVDLRLVSGVATTVPVINPATDGPETTREIFFATPRAEADAPRGGDLVAFGVPSRISEDVELIGIEPGEDLSAVLTGVRYVAPLLMAGETGPIPELQTRLTRQRAASPPAPRLLGVQPDPAGVRVSFDMPPWSGSPITGFSARWRPTPPAGLETGWQSLPTLAADARVLLVPSPRALPSAPGDEEGATRIDVELRAITAAGQTSPVPMTLSGQEVREDPFAPTNLTVTPATRTAPGGSSHGVLVVSADALAAAQGVEMVLEVRRYPPEGGSPDAWESAGLALAAANPVGDILGLRSGTQYGVRGAWRSAAGWPSVWTAEVTATVPAGSNVSDDVVNIGNRPAVDLLAQVDATEQAVEDAEAAIAQVAADLDAAEATLAGEIEVVDGRLSAARAALMQQTERLFAEMARAKVGILSEQKIRVSEMAVQVGRIDGLLARMTDAEGGITAAEALIANLEEVTVDLENPSSLASQLAVLSSSLDTLEGDLNAQISTINTTLTQQGADLSALAGEVQVLDDGLVALQGDTDDNAAGLLALSGRTDLIEAEVDALGDDVVANAAEIGSVSQAVATNFAAGTYQLQWAAARTARGGASVLAETLVRISDREALYDALEVVEIDLTGAIDGLDGELTTLSGTVANHTTLIADLDAGKVDLSDFNTLSGAVSSQGTAISGALSRLDTVELALPGKASVSSVTALEARVTDAEDALDDLDGRQTASEAGLTTVVQAIATEEAASLFQSQYGYAKIARGGIAVLAERSLRVTAEAAIYTALDAVELGLSNDITALEGTVSDHTQALLDLENGKVDLSDFTALSGTVSSQGTTISGHSSRLDAVELDLTGKASVSSVDAIGLDVDGLSADLSIVATAVADLEGIVAAQITLKVDVNGRVTALVIDGVEQTLSLLGSRIYLGGNTAFDDASNTFITDSGGGRTIQMGPFGASGDLIFWQGADSVSPAAATTANGTRAITRDGKAYVNGNRQQDLYRETARAVPGSTISTSWADVITHTIGAGPTTSDSFHTQVGLSIQTSPSRTRSTTSAQVPAGDWEVVEQDSSGTTATERKIASGRWATQIAGGGLNPEYVTSITIGSPTSAEMAEWSDISREWPFKYGAGGRLVVRMRADAGAGLISPVVDLRSFVSRYI